MGQVATQVELWSSMPGGHESQSAGFCEFEHVRQEVLHGTQVLVAKSSVKPVAGQFATQV